MGWTRGKTGDAVGRPRRESLLPGHPDAKFFRGKRSTGTKRQKASRQDEAPLRRITIMVSLRGVKGLAMNARCAGALDPAPAHRKNTFRAMSLWPVLKRPRMAGFEVTTEVLFDTQDELL